MCVWVLLALSVSVVSGSILNDMRPNVFANVTVIKVFDDRLDCLKAASALDGGQADGKEYMCKPTIKQ